MASRALNTIPKAFLCSSTNEIMECPVLALPCGHVFDKKTVEKLSRCPIDFENIDHAQYIYINELKLKIQDFVEKHFHNRPDKKETLALQALNKSDYEFNPKTELQEHKPYVIVKNAHQDDIHGFILNRDRIVSGSKDGSLKFWSLNAAPLNTIKSSNNGYRFWITALENFSDGHFAVGTRDGKIIVFDSNDKECFENNSSNTSPSSLPICKTRNISRINCIKQLKEYNKEHLFFVGVAKHLQLWNLKNKRFIKSFNASDNDWVYCIEPFQKGDMVVVVGSNMEYWKKMNNAYFQKTSLIKETLQEKKSQQRPHISSITRLQDHQNIMAASLFSGDVKLADLETQRVVKTFSEHEGRVWSVCNVNSSDFASSADDKTIKIWDIRQNSSVLTLKDNPGRVSSLMQLKDNIFISGSCPDHVFETTEKASISFWDLRKILK